MKRLFITCILAILIPFSSVFAAVKGRVDLGFVDLKMQLLESGKTINTVWLRGSRFDATLLPFEGYGIAFKGSATVATGNGDIFNGSLALAHYTPIFKKIIIVPCVGWSYTNLRSIHDVPLIGVGNVREKIRSNGVFVGGDIIYTINDQWMVTAIVQYSWAWSTTFLATKNEPSSVYPGGIYPDDIAQDGDSQGFNGAAVVDYYFTKNWSLSGAYGYNSALSKEKHGLKASGWKVGIGYTF